MNISQAAVASGLPAKTIRYYEDIGLVVPGRHPGNDYRIYCLADVDQLRFLQRARAVGFNLQQCRELLSLYINPQRRCAQAKVLVTEKLTQIDQQLVTLNAIRQTLEQMASECPGDDSQDCAIINSLAASPVAMTFTLVEDAKP